MTKKRYHAQNLLSAFKTQDPATLHIGQKGSAKDERAPAFVVSQQESERQAAASVRGRGGRL